MQIETLDPIHQDVVEEVVDLHYRELSDSPILDFGRQFVRQFYYDAFVRDGLVVVTLCRAEGKVVGFICYTATPQSFMAVGMRRRFAGLAWLMTKNIFARPSLLGRIGTVLRMIHRRFLWGAALKDTKAGTVDGEQVGEVLSLIALGPYQNKVPRGGKSRLTVRLFEEMAEYFRKDGIRKVHLMVKPENRASNIFCNVMGCTFEKITVDGESVHRYTYTIPDGVETKSGAVPT